MTKKQTKKVIVIVGDEDVKAPFVEAFSYQIKKSLSFKKIVLDILEEATGRKISNDFGPVFKVESHHVRRFFNKIQNGVYSVQNYIGKSLKTKEEMIEYFVNYIGSKAYGADWLIKETVNLFEKSSDDLYLITDLTLEEAKKLKDALKNSLSLVLVAEASDEKMDFLVKPQPSKAATRRVTAGIIEKLTPTKPKIEVNTETNRNQEKM